MGELGDEGSDQYRVGEEGEHGMRVPPNAVSPRGEVDLRRRQFDRAVTYARSGRAVSQDNVEEISPMPITVR